MNSELAFRKLIEQELNDDFAVFCGAGISMNSGLPSAKNLKKFILENLFPESQTQKDDINEIESALPFEVFMEAILSEFDDLKIFDLFKIGIPNTNHILLAKLAEIGYLKTIYTTNFDQLIERAFKDEQSKRTRERENDLEVYFSHEQFLKLTTETEGQKIKLVKLHGSVEDTKSTRAILATVANQSNFDNLSVLLKGLFCSEKYKKVLILGYSFSDRFDVNQIFRSLKEIKAEVLIVDHSDEKEVIKIENIDANDSRDFLRGFKGKKITCHTDIFVKCLWQFYYESIDASIGPYKESTSTADWQNDVENWTTGLEKHKGFNKYYIAGYLLNRISNYEKCIMYIEDALKIAKKLNDKTLELECYDLLSQCYLYRKIYQVQEDYGKKILKIASKIKNPRMITRAWINLGTAAYSQEDFSRAKSYFKKAMKNSESEPIKLSCYIGLSIAYCGLGYYQKSINYSKDALKIALKFGDKFNEANCYLNLGIAYMRSKHFDIAVEYTNMAKKIGSDIGNPDLEERAYKNMDRIDHLKMAGFQFSTGKFNTLTTNTSYQKSNVTNSAFIRFRSHIQIFTLFVLILRWSTPAKEMWWFLFILFILVWLAEIALKKTINSFDIHYNPYWIEFWINLNNAVIAMCLAFTILMFFYF